MRGILASAFLTLLLPIVPGCVLNEIQRRPVLPEPAPVLKGVVYANNDTGTRLMPDVTVRVFPLDTDSRNPDKALDQTETDEHGRFSLPGVPPYYRDTLVRLVAAAPGVANAI